MPMCIDRKNSIHDSPIKPKPFSSFKISNLVFYTHELGAFARSLSGIVDWLGGWEVGLRCLKQKGCFWDWNIYGMLGYAMLCYVGG